MTVPSDRVAELKAEIVERMGVCPSFFLVAEDSPQVMENLWAQAKSAYLDNPLPSLFKEKLITYLSRFCRVSYCVARHCGFLLGAGRVAGDDSSPDRLSTEELLELLQIPFPSDEALDSALDTLANITHPLDAWPESGSELEKALFACVAPVFLRRAGHERIQAELRRILGKTHFLHLVEFLSFIRSAHFWTETHPDLPYERDLRQLLSEQEALHAWLQTYPDVVGEELRQQEQGDLARLRAVHSTLRESEHRFRTLSETIPAIVWVCDAEGELSYLNHWWTDFTGLTEEDSRGKGWVECIHPEDRERVVAQWEQCIQTGETCEGEVRYRRHDGQFRWHAFHGLPLRDSHDQITSWCGTSFDIHDQKQAQKSLQDSEQFSRRLIDNLFAFVGVLELDGTLLETNAAALEAAGISREEVYGKKFWDTHWWNYSPKVQEQLRDALERARKGKFVRYDVEVHVTGDDLMPIDFQLAPLRNEAGEITHLIPSGVDITSRKTAEQALQELNEELEHRISERTTDLAKREREFRMLADNVPTMFTYIGKDLRYRFVNRAYERFFQVNQDQIIGKKVPDFLGETAWATIGQGVERALRGETVKWELKAPIPKNEVNWFEAILVPNLEEGQVEGVFVLVLNITERRKTEQELRLKDYAIDSAITGVAFGDLDGKITYANPAFVHMFGYENAAEIIGRPNRDFSSAGSVIDEIMQGVLDRGNWQGEDIALKKDGTEFPVELGVALMSDPDGVPLGIVATFIDITRRRQALDSLKESEERFRRIFENAATAIAIRDWDGQIQLCNPSYCQLIGYTEEELRQIPFNLLIHEADRETNQEQIRRLKAGEVSFFKIENRFIHKEGNTVWVQKFISTLPDKTGKPAHLLALVTDITERKRYQENLEEMVEERTRKLREAQADLVKTERLAVLGKLAGGVAHEIRTPLGVILNAIHYLEEAPDLASNPELPSILQEMKRAIRNSDRIISEMLDYVREPIKEPTVFSMAEAVNDAIQCAMIPENIRVNTDVDRALEVQGNQDQLTRILINLITNAVQAMPDGGHLEIEAKTDREAIRVSVSDSGSGIPPENLEKIFDPLFSTKTTGIGLGLAICRRYAEMHGGSLEATSELGKGTTFTLMIERQR